MSAPGAGEGVSWVDVAASAAGIYAQMQAIGAQAAEGLARGMSARLPSMITPVVHGSFQAAMAGLEARGAAVAGAAAAEAYGATFRSTLQKVVGQAMAQTSGMMSLPVEGISADVQRSLAKVGPALRASLNKELREAFAAAEAGTLGEKMATDITRGFSQGVGNFRQTLSTLLEGGVIGEAQAAAAGQRLGRAITGGLGSTLSELKGTGGWLDAVLGQQAAAEAETRAAQISQRMSQALAGGLGANLRETMQRSSAVAAEESAQAAINAVKARLGPELVAAFAGAGANAGTSAGEAAAATLTERFGALAGSGAGALAAAGAQIGANLTASMMLRKRMTDEFEAAQAGTSEAANQFGARVGQFFRGGLVNGVGDFRSLLVHGWESGAVGEAQAAAAGKRIGEALTGGLRQTIAELTGSGGIAAAISNATAQANSQAVGNLALTLAQSKNRAMEALKFDDLGMKIAPQFSEAGRVGAEALGQGLQGHLAGLVNKFMPASLRPAVNAFFGQVGKDAGSAFRVTGAQEMEEATRAMGGKMLSGWDKFGGEGAAAAANAAGKMSMAMKVGLVGLALLGVDVAASMVKNMVNVINTEATAFAKVGKDAAEALMGGFKSIIEGQMPDVQQVIGVGLEGIQTAMQMPLNVMTAGLDATIGKIPILGGMITSAVGEASSVLGGFFSVLQTYTGIAGEFGNTLLEIGNKWQDTARTIAGQTIDLGNLSKYVDVVRDIAASGDLVHFKDVSHVVGELNQRLSGLNDGAGLSRQQLINLATAVAEANELLGDIHINVDLFTGALNDFNIKAEDTTKELTFVANLARETGADFNTMSEDVDQVAPAMIALGYSMDQVYFILGKMNEEMGKPAMTRWAFGIAQVMTHFENLGYDQAHVNQAMSDFVDTVRGYVAVGNDMAAIDFAKGIVQSSRTANIIVDAVKHNVFATAEDIQKLIDAQGAALTQPLDQALNATKSLQQSVEQLSNSVLAALAPLGTALVNALGGAGESMTEWLQTHQAEFVQWVGSIGEWLLQAGVTLMHGLAGLLHTFAPFVESAKNMMVSFAEDMALMLDHFSFLMPGLHEAIAGLVTSMERIRNVHLDTAMNALGDGANWAAGEIQGLEGPLARITGNAADAAKMVQAFSATFKDLAAGDDAAKFQLALQGSVKDGLTIAPEVHDKIIDQLHHLGVTVSENEKGIITGFTAHSQAQLDAVNDMLNSTLGPEEFAKLGGTVKFSLDMTPEQAKAQFLKDHLGVPSEFINAAGDLDITGKGGLFGDNPPPWVTDLTNALKEFTAGGGKPTTPPSQDPGNAAFWVGSMGASISDAIGTYIDQLLGGGRDPIGSWFSGHQFGGTVTGPGGTDNVLIRATAGEKVMNLGASQRFGPVLDAMNAQAFANGGTVMDAAGVPANMQTAAFGAGAIALPAGINVVTPPPMTVGDTLTNAGIPDKLQGDVEQAGVTETGVSLPTALTTKDQSRKDATEVMTAAGIPNRMQGDDGVQIDVKLNLVPGQQLSVGGDGGGDGAAAGPQPGPHTVAAWSQPVHDIMLKYGGQAGIPVEAYPAWEHAILTQIQTESSGNPDAKATDPNDPNVRAGIPSLGLLQYTPGTYRAHNPTGLPYPNPYGEIAATLFYAPHDAAGYPAHGQSRSIGEGHGFQKGGRATLKEDKPVSYKGFLGFQGGGGVRSSLSYHSESHLAPHVGLPVSKTSVWSHMLDGGLLGFNGGGDVAGGGDGATGSKRKDAWGQLLTGDWWKRILREIRYGQLGGLVGMAGGGVPIMPVGGDRWSSPDPEWAHLIMRESSGRPNVTQSAGVVDVNTGGNEAEGLFQITPQTWAGHGGAEFGTPHPGMATPQQQAIVAARIIRANPTASDWIGDPPVEGREDPVKLLSALGPLDAALAVQAHQMKRQQGGGVRSSLSYHSESHLAPHVGLPVSKTSVWSHMLGGGLLGFNGGGVLVYDRNAPWATGGDYRTSLTPQQESAFRQWVRDRKVPFDPNEIHPDYDMRGFWLHSAERDYWHPGQHFPDTWKTPYHKSFSNQSMYAKPGTPFLWKGDTLIDARTGAPVPGFVEGGPLQVIYNPPGTQEYYGEAAGYGRVGPGTSQPQYYNADWGGHHGHVHTSFDTGPDGMPYGMPIGTNLPGGGKEHPEFASAGFPWVLQLGRRYGIYGSTYPGHQEHGGKNHGIDWWPTGKADMSGMSYTPEETNRLRTFASAMVSAGGGGTWGPSVGAGTYNATLVSSYGRATHGPLNPVLAALAGLVKGVLEALGFKLPEEFFQGASSAAAAPAADPNAAAAAGLGDADKRVVNVQSGGHIKGYHLPGRDTVPMMVPPGTFILNRHRSMQYRDIADNILGMAAGGMIPIITEPGERVFPPGSAPPGFLHAMNQGRLLRRVVGGQVGPDPPPGGRWVTNPDGSQTAFDADGNPTGSYIPPGGEAGQVSHPAILVKGPGKVPETPGAAPQPPPGAEKFVVPPGSVGAHGIPAITIPGVGTFNFSFELSPEQQALITPSEREKMDRYLDEQRKAMQRSADAQGTATDAQERLNADIATRDQLHKDYDDAVRDRTDALKREGKTDQQITDILQHQLMDTTQGLGKKHKEWMDAETKVTDDTKALGTATQHVTDDLIQQQITAEKTTGKAAATTPDENAAAMGSGLIKGMAQELGFGDVFGKPPWQWGIWKLFAGGASAALGIANQLGEAGGGYGAPALGGQVPPSAAATPPAAAPGGGAAVPGAKPGQTDPAKMSTKPEWYGAGMPDPATGLYPKVPLDPEAAQGWRPETDKSGKVVGFVPKGAQLPSEKLSGRQAGETPYQQQQRQAQEATTAGAGKPPPGATHWVPPLEAGPAGPGHPGYWAGEQEQQIGPSYVVDPNDPRKLIPQAPPPPAPPPMPVQPPPGPPVGPPQLPGGATIGPDGKIHMPDGTTYQQGGFRTGDVPQPFPYPGLQPGPLPGGPPGAPRVPGSRLFPGSPMPFFPNLPHYHDPTQPWVPDPKWWHHSWPPTIMQQGGIQGAGWLPASQAPAGGGQGGGIDIFSLLSQLQASSYPKPGMGGIQSAMSWAFHPALMAMQKQPAPKMPVIHMPAMGGHADGYLPAEAKIQPATPHLVQWAEPSTGGEAFIPINGGGRSRAIWAETGRRLGVQGFQEGGIHPSSPAAVVTHMASSQASAGGPGVSAISARGGSTIGTAITINNHGVTPGHVFDAQAQQAINQGTRTPQMAGGGGVPK